MSRSDDEDVLGLTIKHAIQSHWKARDYAGLIRIYRSHPLMPDPRSRLRCSIAFGRLGRWDECVECLSVGLEQQPEPALYYERSLARLEQGCWDEAIGDTELCLLESERLNSTFYASSALAVRCVAFYHLGDRGGFGRAADGLDRRANVWARGRLYTIDEMELALGNQ